MEGYVLVDNGCLTEKEARMNMEQCADFLARMIQKYGPAKSGQASSWECPHRPNSSSEFVYRRNGSKRDNG